MDAIPDNERIKKLSSPGKAVVRLPRNGIISAIIVCGLSACTDNMLPSGNDDPESIISFRTEIIDCQQSRGIPVNAVSDTTFKDFRIFARQASGTVTTFAEAPTVYLNGEVVTKTDGRFLLNPTHYWPQGYLNFLAYAPADASGITEQLNAQGVPQLQYTVPDSVSIQPDLMIAVTRLNQNRVTVPVTFRHALACISFEASGPDVTIDSIAVSGVVRNGYVSTELYDEAGDPQWSDLSAPSDKQIQVPLISNPVASEKPAMMTAPDGYLMMIPQTLTEDAVVRIWFKGLPMKEMPLRTDAVTEWKAGVSYGYTLREGSYTFEVTPLNPELTYAGGTFKLDINSYFTSQNGSIRAQGWTADVVGMTGTPDWIASLNDLSTLSDATGGAEILKELICGVSYYSSTSEIDARLRQTDSIKLASPLDLSYNAKTQRYTSSNTYVVNAPGWYEFPCFVMGNGISNATSATINNSQCFSTVTPYKNYLGTEITTRGNLRLDVSGASASLVWSDTPDLVSNISLQTEKQSIRFYVSPDAIRQGNAIIALKDASGMIMWSWQIWVTDWQLGEDDQPLNSGGVSLGFMKYNIGRCAPATYNYPENTVTFRFTQNQTGLAQQITLTQQAAVIKLGENCVYYQWGRKDPMVGAIGFNGLETNKPSFGPLPFEIIGEGARSIPYAIQHPQQFIPNSSDVMNWNSDLNIYLWRIDGSDGETYKSIYDPSPAGYRVFSNRAVNALIGLSYQYLPGDPANGTPLQVTFSGTGSHVTLDAMGARAYDGGLEGGLYTFGLYWIDEVYNGFQIDNLLFHEGANPYWQVNGTALAMPVGAVRDLND